MNIFASFACPAKSARWLDDQRQIKMILESAQLLSTVAHLYGVWRPPMLKPTHMTHPCSLWLCDGRENFDWLWEHMLALDKYRLARMTSKNGKTHKAAARLIEVKAWETRNYLPLGKTQHVNCARNSSVGVDFTHIKDVHLAYRLYLKHRWSLQDRPAVCTLPRRSHDRD